MIKPTLDAARETLERIIGPNIDLRPSPNKLADGVVQIGNNRYLLEVKGSARYQTIAQAMLQLERAAEDARFANYRRLIFVDHMGETGRALCKEYGVNWMDLAGNADIQGDGLLVRVQGQRSRVRTRAETAFNPFSRSASRIVHVLLSHPHESLPQRDIAIEATQPKGTVSRALSTLQHLGFIEAITDQKQALFRVTHWDRLLDAWLEAYKAPRTYASGLVSARDGFDAMTQVADELRKRNVPYYFSGLAAAAHYTKFGSFRRVLVYIDTVPSELRERFNVSDDTRGRNVLFLRDDGNAKIGADHVDNYNFVSPYVTLMDLTREPERSEEATEAMRRMIRQIWK